MAKSKGIAGKIAAGALALVIAAGGVSLLGYTSRDTNGNWFGGLHWADNKITADGDDVKNENGGAVITEGVSSGMRLMSTMIAEEDYEEYGVSALAESATIITATFTPEATTNKNVTWTCSDTSGKVTVTPVSGNPLQATVAVTGAFGTQVTITCTSQANNAIKSSLTVDYVKGLELKSAPKTFNSIKSTIKLGDYSLSTGTINPTSYSGNVEMLMNIDLYNYLKTKHSTVVQSKIIATSVDEINNSGEYYFKELFGTTSESEINSIYEDIAIYYYGETGNVMVCNLVYKNVTCYYNGVATSTLEGNAIANKILVSSFSDIYVNPTGVSLSDGSLIFGANGEV